VVTAQPSPADAVQPSLAADTVVVSETFSHCGLVRRTCVVDGDTFWLHGQKIRVADIDTPEVSQPQCAAEKALGDRATDRLVVLLNQGPFEMTPIGNRDEDQYGRKLRVIVRAGRSLGDQLVAEGLARTWTGQREPWC
jgi:micrococcal nuclease